MTIARPYRRNKGCGAGCFASLFFTLVLLCVDVTGASAALIETLQQRAAEQRLADQRPWQALLHTDCDRGRCESVIDDAAFFLAPQGKSDPAAELSADIAALFTPAESGDEHFQCRFPVRSAWLIRELSIDEAVLPRPRCEKLDAIVADINPQSAVLVFPAAHMNSPASMFGHTLLRVGGNTSNDLLSYAINYAAQTAESNGFLYAFKGIFGLYSGYFTVLPYYAKLNEYSELEHRDLWEYPLKLDEDEVRRMLLHSWELQGIAADYYFFDENCSYMLLYLLEVARPELRLTEEYRRRLSFWVIPVDTLATVQRSGIAAPPDFRPALATRIAYRASLLDDAAQRRARAITAGERPAATEAKAEDIVVEERRQVLDLATEYLQYRFSRKEIDQTTFRGQFLAILRERSQLGTSAVDPGQMTKPSPPESGHDSGRVSVGLGSRNGHGTLDLGWRPAYHSLGEADTGFKRGAQINFFDVAGRFDPEHGTLRLQRFLPVDVVSLAPRDHFFKPVSWKVNFGLRRQTVADGSARLVGALNTGGGMAWEVTERALLYSLLEADLEVSGGYRHNAALGGGLSLGGLLQPLPRWKVLANATALGYAGEEHRLLRLALDQNLWLSRRSELVLGTHWEERFGVDAAEITLALHWFF